MAIDERAVAGLERRESAAALGRCRRHVVDHPADRRRAVGNLARAFQHLDALDALDGRVVVRGVVAIRRKRQGHAVLEQQHLRRPRGVEAADADVGSQPEPLFVAHVDAADLAQRLVDGEDVGGRQRLCVEYLNRAWQAAQFVWYAGQACGPDRHRFRDGCRCERDGDLVWRRRHIECRSAEAAERHHEAVVALQQLASREAPVAISGDLGHQGARAAAVEATHLHDCSRQWRTAGVDDVAGQRVSCEAGAGLRGEACIDRRLLGRGGRHGRREREQEETGAEALGESEHRGHGKPFG